MPLGVLRRLSDVDDEQVAVAAEHSAELLNVDERADLRRSVRGLPRLEPAIEIADDLLVPDAQRLPDQPVPVVERLDQQHQRTVVRDHPPEPGPERAAGRDGQRTGRVARGVSLGRARVDEQSLGCEHLSGALHRHGSWLRDGPERSRAGPIDGPHALEVARVGRLVGQEHAHEGLDILDRQEPVVPPLVADRRPRRRRDVLGAERTAAVGRQDRDEVLVGEQAIVQ
jgi:hypothetical protein